MLVSSDVVPIEMENLVELPWDVVILDARWIAKGATARLAGSLADIKCPHFVATCEMPLTEINLINTLRLIDDRHSVGIPPLVTHEGISGRPPQWRAGRG